MNGRQYESPGPFGRAVERALEREARRPVPPSPPLCRVGGCALPAGHVERVGTEHQPRPWVSPADRDPS